MFVTVEVKLEALSFSKAGSHRAREKVRHVKGHVMVGVENVN